MKRLITFGSSFTYGQGLADCWNPKDNSPGAKPSAQAWPALLAKMLDRTVVNLGSPGASNLEILTTILNFKFEPTDCVVIGWTYPDRDLIFRKPGLLRKDNLRVGPWLDKVFENWCAVHSEYDIGVRGWLNIHHANIFLESMNIELYNFFLDHELMMKYKPSFIDVPITNIDFFKLKDIDKACDNLHPGLIVHKLAAEALNKEICK
jgi:hypothetical protein